MFPELLKDWSNINCLELAVWLREALLHTIEYPTHVTNSPFINDFGSKSFEYFSGGLPGQRRCFLASTQREFLQEADHICWDHNLFHNTIESTHPGLSDLIPHNDDPIIF